MTKEELEFFNPAESVRKSPTIRAPGGEPRTLLFGYDCDRRTYHVYKSRHGTLIFLIYDRGDQSGLRGYKLVSIEESLSAEHGLDAASLVPNKRLYPEACDFAFCRDLDRLGVHMTFTTLDQTRAAKPFHGLCIEQFDTGFAADEVQLRRRALILESDRA